MSSVSGDGSPWIDNEDRVREWVSEPEVTSDAVLDATERDSSAG